MGNRSQAYEKGMEYFGDGIDMQESLLVAFALFEERQVRERERRITVAWSRVDYGSLGGVTVALSSLLVAEGARARADDLQVWPGPPAAGEGTVFSRFGCLTSEIQYPKRISLGQKVYSGKNTKFQSADVFKHYTVHEKKYGERAGIEDVIVSKRKAQYEAQVRVWEGYGSSGEGLVFVD